MTHRYRTAVGMLAFAFTATAAFAPSPVRAAALVTVTPGEVLQGEPALVRVTAAGREIQTLTFKGSRLPLLTFAGDVVALLGTDFRETPGSYPVRAVFTDGTSYEATLVVRERTKEVLGAPDGVPEEIGGDTDAGRAALLARLASENAVLAGLWSNPRMLWRTPFRFPVANQIITDRYGYLRDTGGSSVAHKGTDFRAAYGTPVYAMNRGVVRLARTFTVYGKTVIVDHGLGTQTFYMHLSRIAVNAGQLVQAGELIGWSGATGYASGPHLHVSVRVGGVSVDPERFIALFLPPHDAPAGIVVPSSQ